jgi:SAM-dependent methyltransferase
LTNIDYKTVESFGDEWSRFSQEQLTIEELKYLFNKYFDIFPWNSLPDNAEGFDMGCGSGRWAFLVAPKVARLNCVDPSNKALEVARRRLENFTNIKFFNASVSEIPLPPNSQDFGYSLGVLHHVPNTSKAIKDCVEMLKSGAPFLIYLYYKFDNRSRWYKFIWYLSNLLRQLISRMPPFLKLIITNIIAIIIYFPLARIALLGEKVGLNVNNWLLSSYRKTSFYTMKTDSRDRFGTPLEKRFTREEIFLMMKNAGLENIKFSENFPFWCAVGVKI